MIQTINGWRAVFALMIVLFHVGATSFEEMTWAGVTFFLMASGFLMARKYPFEQLDGQSYRPFAWNHAAKLFPLHWLTLVLWLVAMALLGMLAIKPVALAHSPAPTHQVADSRRAGDYRHPHSGRDRRLWTHRILRLSSRPTP